MKKAMSGRSIVSITPTFYLRGIDPQHVLEQYQAGKYRSVTLPKEKLQIHAVPAAVHPTYSNDPSAEIYALQMKNKSIQIIATTNNPQYNFFNKEGKKLPQGQFCQWCREEFTEEFMKKIKGQVIGIPIRVTMIGDKIICHADGEFCRWSCEFAALKWYNRILPRDPLYTNSEQLSHQIFFKMCPDAGPLRSAPDFRLHQRFGGPLDDKNFHDSKYKYIRTGNVIYSPLKVEYLRV